MLRSKATRSFSLIVDNLALRPRGRYLNCRFIHALFKHSSAFINLSRTMISMSALREPNRDAASKMRAMHRFLPKQSGGNCLIGIQVHEVQ